MVVTAEWYSLNMRNHSIVVGIGALFAVGLLLGCDQQGTLNFSTGPLDLVLSSSSVAVPMELRSDESPRIVRTLPCPMVDCRSSDDLEVLCVDGSCNPSPLLVEVRIGEPLDVDELVAGLPKAFPEADSYTIRDISYSISLNTLSLDVPELTLLWSPEGAPTGTTRLATLSSIPARSSQSGQATVDLGGEAALSDFLTGTSPRVRFHAQTELDLEPGDPFPEGELSITMEVALTASGRLID